MGKTYFGDQGCNLQSSAAADPLFWQGFHGTPMWKCLGVQLQLRASLVLTSQYMSCFVLCCKRSIGNPRPLGKGPPVSPLPETNPASAGLMILFLQGRKEGGSLRWSSSSDIIKVTRERCPESNLKAFFVLFQTEKRLSFRKTAPKQRGRFFKKHTNYS